MAEAAIDEADAVKALDLLDATKGPVSSLSVSGGGIAFFGASTAARRPKAHGGVLSRPLQPLSNRSQRFTLNIRADPLECENCCESAKKASRPPSCGKQPLKEKAVMDEEVFKVERQTRRRRKGKEQRDISERNRQQNNFLLEDESDEIHFNPFLSSSSNSSNLCLPSPKSGYMC